MNLHSLDSCAICQDLVDLQLITKVFSKVDWHDERELGHNSAHSAVVKEFVQFLRALVLLHCQVFNHLKPNADALPNPS